MSQKNNSKKTGYLAMRLMTEATTDGGLNVKLNVDSAGTVGVMPVFKTKKAARAIYGEKIKLIEIWECQKEGK